MTPWNILHILRPVSMYFQTGLEYLYYPFDCQWHHLDNRALFPPVTVNKKSLDRPIVSGPVGHYLLDYFSRVHLVHIITVQGYIFPTLPVTN